MVWWLDMGVKRGRITEDEWIDNWIGDEEEKAIKDAWSCHHGTLLV